MGRFNQENKFKGRRSSSAGRNDRGGRGDRPDMHSAVCSECGNDCQVPFRPTGDKPVFCSECFGKKEGGGGRSDRYSDRRSGGRSSGGRSSFGDKQMHRAICDKCHEECEVPFKPSSDKPIYCNNCFGKNDRGDKRDGARNSGGSSAQYKEDFAALNKKLDDIMNFLGMVAAAPVKEVSESKSAKEEKSVKKVDLSKAKAAKAEKKPVAKKTTKAVAKKETKTVTAKKPVAKKVAVKKAAPKKVATPKKKAATKKK